MTITIDALDLALVAVVVVIMAWMIGVWMGRRR